MIDVIRENNDRQNHTRRKCQLLHMPYVQWITLKKTNNSHTILNLSLFLSLVFATVQSVEGKTRTPCISSEMAILLETCCRYIQHTNALSIMFASILLGDLWHHSKLRTKCVTVEQVNTNSRWINYSYDHDCSIRHTALNISETEWPYHLYYITTTFNGSLFQDTWVSQYQTGKTSLDLNKTRDDGVWGCSGIICKQSAPRSRQITTPTPHHSFFLQAGCSFWRPTNSVKALKADLNTKKIIQFVHGW